MTTSNPFVLDKSEYKRDLNLITHAIQDHAKYISKMTGKDYQYCIDYVVNLFKNDDKYKFNDPKIRYLERSEYGDRKLCEGTLLNYISYAIKNKHLIAPTFTTYLNPEQKESLLVGYIENNIAIRDKAKIEMFAAKMAKNKRLQLFKKGEQMNKKILNNGVSGAHVSKSTPLVNKTAHSTLTSNCRSTSAFGNANNEKLFAGNRHYHHPTIAFNNVISLVNRTDLVSLDNVIKKYNLHYPTADEAYECIMRSCRLYWRSKENEERLQVLMSKLEPIERAAVVYVGDLYHVRKFNNDFVKKFIGNIANRTMEVAKDPESIFSSNRAEYVGLVVQLFGDMMKGKTIDEVKEDSVYAILASNIEKIHTHLIDMSDFIEAIFVTDNVPASLAYFPESVRHVALTSDTDSTIFTVQDWINWYFGSYEVNDESNAVCAALIFIAAESITHVLARMSANFGIIEDRIFQVAMKNEYRFDVFTPTNIGKHYFALIGCQEGNLYEKYDNEIKGVHLRSSSVANGIIKKAEDMMVRIMELALKAKKFKIFPFLKEIADLEREVVSSIIAGEKTYLRSGRVNAPQSYTRSEEESPYQHYVFWNSVFGDKYGIAPPPPYMCSKIAVSLKNQKAIKEWCESIEDVSVRNKAIAWNNNAQKATMNMLLIPSDIISVKGIPSEIIPILDVRRTILDVTKVFYIVMEALGIYVLNDKITRLISDEY